MACQYFASIINNKRGTVKFWNFVRKENLSLWEGFCKFILKHDISNRRRTWACPRQKCVKERQVAIVAVVEVVKSYLVAIYPFCWVRYIWYISSWISALYFHKLPVPLFLHSLDLCTLSTRSVLCLHSAQSHNKIFWSIKSIATDFELHQYNSSECQERKNVMPKDKQTNKPKNFLLNSYIYAENDFISLI